jgi:hypothetical protein
MESRESKIISWAGSPVGRHTVIEFKGRHVEGDVILWGSRWHVADPITYRQVEEMIDEREGRLTMLIRLDPYRSAAHHEGPCQSGTY